MNKYTRVPPPLDTATYLPIPRPVQGDPIPDHWDLGSGPGYGWWACHFPERKHDGGTVWNVYCWKCLLAYRASQGHELGSGAVPPLYLDDHPLSVDVAVTD